MGSTIKKNILDLQFQKYLVIASTAIIIFFTYLIGIAIALIAKQIVGSFSIIVIIVLSIAIGSIYIIFFLNARKEMKEIVVTLKQL